jgi:hypothetical protein
MRTKLQRGHQIPLPCLAEAERDRDTQKEMVTLRMWARMMTCELGPGGYHLRACKRGISKRVIVRDST